MCLEFYMLFCITVLSHNYLCLPFCMLQLIVVLVLFYVLPSIFGAVTKFCCIVLLYPAMTIKFIHILIQRGIWKKTDIQRLARPLNPPIMNLNLGLICQPHRPIRCLNSCGSGQNCVALFMHMSHKTTVCVCQHSVCAVEDGPIPNQWAEHCPGYLKSMWSMDIWNNQLWQ